jgi:hypothetical protein
MVSSFFMPFSVLTRKLYDFGGAVAVVLAVGSDCLHHAGGETCEQIIQH